MNPTQTTRGAVRALRDDMTQREHWWGSPPAVRFIAQLIGGACVTVAALAFFGLLCNGPHSTREILGSVLAVATLAITGAAVFGSWAYQCGRDSARREVGRELSRIISIRPEFYDDLLDDEATAAIAIRNAGGIGRPGYPLTQGEAREIAIIGQRGELSPEFKRWAENIKAEADAAERQSNSDSSLIMKAIESAILRGIEQEVERVFADASFVMHGDVADEAIEQVKNRVSEQVLMIVENLFTTPTPESERDAIENDRR